MKLLAITGMDGTGKSTLAKNLVATLDSKYIDAVYVYGRIVPVISRVLMYLGRVVFLRGTNLHVDYGQYSTAKQMRMKNPVLRFFYTTAILTDYYLQIWLKLAPYVFSRRLIVVDRYIYDTVISDLTVHLNYSPENNDATIMKCLRYVPKPRVTILLDVDPEVAFRRKNDVVDISYLEERRNWFLRLQDFPNVVKIDSGKKIDEITEEVLVYYFSEENELV